MVVQFESKEIGDAINSNASNLANFRDEAADSEPLAEGFQGAHVVGL